MSASGVTLSREEIFVTPVNSLAKSLRDIRLAFERLDSLEMEIIYLSDIHELLQQMRKANHAVSAAKTDPVEGRRQLLELTTELEDDLNENADLEYVVDVSTLTIAGENSEARETITELQEMLQKTREILASHLADHRTLIDSQLSFEHDRNSEV